MQLTNIHHAPVTPLSPPSEATRATRVLEVDAEALAADLRASIDGEVRSDAGSRPLYATDTSNYRQIPICVVIPRHVNDRIGATAIARRLMSRGSFASA